MMRIALLLIAPLALAAAPAGLQEEYVNAGVFPYTTAPGEITVLLGFDEEEEHWSDFVGVCTPGETPRQTAARQFEEETRGAYRLADISQRLQGAAAVEVGNTHLFLLEVPQVSATMLERLAKDRGYEKTAYCWVPLTELLVSIDERGAGRAEVPASCVAASHDLYDLVGQNLAQGQEMRQRLTAPGGVAPETDLGRSPRCGR